MVLLIGIVMPLVLAVEYHVTDSIIQTVIVCNIILQFWAEKAEQVFPNHDVVFHLKVTNDLHCVT